MKKINSTANENKPIKREQSLQMSAPHLSLRHQERRLFAIRKLMKLEFALMKQAGFDVFEEKKLCCLDFLPIFNWGFCHL